MSDIQVTTDWSEAALVIGIVVLIIFCAGDPDLIDALIHTLMRECEG